LPHVDPATLIDWMARNKKNRFYIQAIAWDRLKDLVVPAARKRGMEIEVSFRSAQYWLPTTLFRDHPEYFALFEGKRECYDYSLRCASSSDAVRLYAENALKWARENPEVDIIHLIMQDGYTGRECQCEGCGKLTPLQQFFTFFDAVADAFEASGVRTKVEYRIYVDCYEPGPETCTRAGVIYDTFYRCNCHTLGEACEGGIQTNLQGHQPSCTDAAVNVFEAEMMQRWRKAVAGDLIIFENIAREAHQNPEPVYHTIEKDLAFYREHEMDGVILLANLHGWFCHARVYYLYARMLWDTSLDAHDVLKRYCDLAYESAAPILYEYFCLLEDGFQAIHGRRHAYLRKFLADLPEAHMERADLLLRNAHQRATTPEARDRLAADQAMLEYGRLLRKQRGILTATWRDGKAPARDAALKATSALIDSCLEVADFAATNMGRRAFDSSRISHKQLLFILRPGRGGPPRLECLDAQLADHLHALRESKEHEGHVLSYSSRSIVEWQMHQERDGLGPDAVYTRFVESVLDGYQFLASLKGKACLCGTEEFIFQRAGA